MQQVPESMLHPNLQVPPGDRLAFLHIPKTAGTSLPKANQPISTSPMNKPTTAPGTIPTKRKPLNKPTSNIV
jgi:hypothetical protein